MVSARPRLNFPALAKCFLDDGVKTLDRKTLKEMINYFINACDETSYLEARGLMASTLLDLIVRKYTSVRKAHNRSFRKSLEFLTKELDLPLDAKACRAAVDIRDQLVHEGTYLSENEGDEWYSQYKFMIWVDLIALCRLTGYEDDLPSLIDGRRLEV